MSWERPEVRTETRCVTVDYLDELQEKAASFLTLRRWLEACVRTDGCTGAEARRIAAAFDRRYGPLG